MASGTTGGSGRSFSDDEDLPAADRYIERNPVRSRLERSDVQSEYDPKLNPECNKAYWLGQPGAPKPKLENEKPQGQTVDLDELIKTWSQGKSMQALTTTGPASTGHRGM